ncbi:MAG: acetate uptake transporter [Bacteroidales bacterium]
MQEITTIRITDTTANPAPLGLLGFGLTTVFLNLTNAGLIPLSSMIMGMGIFVGGIAQIIAGIMESKKNNTFGTVAFTAYGAFWISLVAIWVMPKMGIAEAADPISMGWFLTVWGIFSLGMFVGTFKISCALQFVFGTLVILFALLAIADFTGIHQIKIIAGYDGIICGLAAIYTCLAQILNELYKKELLPLGIVK